MSAPVLIVHTREGCPACITLHKEENMKLIRTACSAQGVELRVITHKFSGGRVTMVDKEKYPKLDPPVFPTFMMVPSSDAHPGGDIGNVKVWNYEVKKEGRGYKLVRGNERGISIPAVQKWIIDTAISMGRSRVPRSNMNADPSQSPVPQPQQAAPSHSHRFNPQYTSESNWRRGRQRTQESNCKNYQVVYLPRHQ